MDLAILWFFIVGVLFVGYFILDGFDFGVGMSLRILGKTNNERRQIINTIGPVWDLNETWVIVGGAALFAAFPEWYATLFSGFYIPLLVILLGLIVRAVAFEYRHQRDSAAWRNGWDWCITIGSAIPALLWGVAFANIAQGLIMEPNPAGGALFTGGLLSLLNPYALLGGVTTLLLFFSHGVIFVALKTTGDVRDRAKSLASKALIATTLLGAAFLVWTIVNTPHWVIVTTSAIAALGLVSAWTALRVGREGLAFTATAVTVAFAVLTLYLSLFVAEGGPFVMPASNPAGDFVGLTVANASSSQYTLEVMSWTALICLPLVLAYQGWTYWVFRKRVTMDTIEAAAH